MRQDHEDRRREDRSAIRNKWVLIGFLAVGAFFLVAEHRAHLYGALPYLLLLACVGMHLFHGHGGHRSHRSHHADVPGQKSDGADVAQTREHGGRKS